jgi:triosephosphate isomerase
MKKLIAGNWKMNLDAAQAVQLVEQLKVDDRSPEVVVCPPFPYLSLTRHVLVGRDIRLGAQDCHQRPCGAFTGDVSANMLADVGCEYVILGHSERRKGHQETNAQIKLKMDAAIGRGLKVILCIGESAEENKAGLTEKVLWAQLKESLPEETLAENYVIAYEPIWAIGTGQTASDEAIAVIHAFIRSILKGVSEEPSSVRILYGGSVTAQNAKGILALDNVNGVLVGGASMISDDFNEIIRAGMCE